MTNDETSYYNRKSRGESVDAARWCLMGIIALLIVGLFAGCSAIPTQDKALNAYAACAGADMGTTAVTLAFTSRVEGNGVILTCAKWMGSTGAAGVLPCLAIFAVAQYHALKLIDNATLTTAAATVSCAVAARNVVMIPQP